MIRTTISGCAGRMGQALVRSILATADMCLAGASEAPGSPCIGSDVGLTCGVPPLGIAVSSDPAATLESADGAIDFSVPEATERMAQLCAGRGIPLVVGTTGFEQSQRASLLRAAETIPMVLAPNMSIGVNVLFRLVREAARLLGPSFDKEIIEAHHRLKVDAPSGTAIQLAQILADATREEGMLVERSCYGREGHTGKRPSGQIGIHAVRGGDIVGEHNVIFCGIGERLELVHRATSRQTFAQGALQALRWSLNKPPGIYNMQDVLGLTHP